MAREETIVAASRTSARKPLAKVWVHHSTRLVPVVLVDEEIVRACARPASPPISGRRATTSSALDLPPGRFLMPGDSGLARPHLRAAARPGEEIAAASLTAMMERRYEAYKTHVMRPFFRDHFSRLDRQIVLVDATALIPGPRRSAIWKTRSPRSGRVSRGPRVDARLDLPPPRRPILSPRPRPTTAPFEP